MTFKDILKKPHKIPVVLLIAFIFSSNIIANASYENLNEINENGEKEDIFPPKIKIAWYDLPEGVEETHIGEKWIRTDLFTSGGGETGCCYLDNNILVISRNKGWMRADEPIDFYFYYLNSTTIHFEHAPNTAEGEELWYGSYAITSGARFGVSMSRLIISNGFYCDGDLEDPINSYGISSNWHFNASYQHGSVHAWSSFPLIGANVPLSDTFDKQDVVTTGGVTYAVSYGNTPTSHTLHVGKNNGTTYSDDLEGLGATWPSVGGGTCGNPVVFAWARDAGGVGIMYQPGSEEEDTESPILIMAENKTVELGSSGNSISWNWTDVNPLNYTIKLGENIIDQGSWTSGEPIELAVSASEIGINNYLCKVNDSQGNENQSYIKYEVEDTTAPNINASPSDVYYSEGDTGNSITWDWDDLDTNYYNITRDSAPIIKNLWNSTTENITINVDGLSAGDYVFRCSVNDSSGNWAHDEVEVIVSSDLSIFGPEDFNYTIGSQGNDIQWTATTCANSDGYKVYQGSSLNQSGSWTSGVPIAFDIDGLAVGDYEFNCSVKDDSGTSTFDIVNITVKADIQAPSLVDASANMEIDESESGIILNWTWTDINPNEYTIKRNGMLVDGNTWISGNEISYSIGSLSINVYEFVCEVNDTYSNTNNHAIQVNVSDKVNPEITDSSPDTEITFLSTDNTINWTWDDLNPGHYEIYQDTDLNSSGVWISGVPIILNIDGLDTGAYDFNCIVNDTHGNVNNHVIKVTIVDHVAPLFGASGKSFANKILYGLIQEYIFWCEWTDDNDFDVKLLLNSTEHVATNVQGNNYSINISNLDVGKYSYSWIATDECYNSNYTMLNYNLSFEIIIEHEAPTHSIPSTENQGNNFSISVNVYDGNFSSGIQVVNLYYSRDKAIWNSTQMIFISSQIHDPQTGELSFHYQTNVIITGILYYYIEIYDNHGNFAKSSIFILGSAANSTNTSTIPADVLGIDPLTLGFLGGITLIGGLSIVLFIRRKKRQFVR